MLHLNSNKKKTGVTDDECTKNVAIMVPLKFLSNFYRTLEMSFTNCAIDLSKQQALDADPKAILQINFTGNLDWAAGATMFSIIEEAKETILDFSQGTVP